MAKYSSIFGAILAGICIGCLGTYVAIAAINTKDGRNTYEYAYLLRNDTERFDYCPYCGEKLNYPHDRLLKDETAQEILDKWKDYLDN